MSLHQATAIRSDMLHFLNVTQSKTLSFPSELWSIIFRLACPTSDVFAEKLIRTPPFHLVLRLVSTLWYDIVQSTPQLWESVSFPKLCAENVDIKGRYLKLCLQNSGGLPLSFSFRFDKELKEVCSFISPNVDKTLELVTHRVRFLQLSRPPRRWLEKLIPKMYQLATIHISNPQIDAWYPRDETLHFPMAANINRIRIICPSLRHLRLDCVTSSVTRVDLFHCPIDFVIEFLLRCHNLTDFRCLYSLAASKIKNPHTMLTSPFVLHYLSTFTWSTNRTFNGISEWDTVLFGNIHFPALRRFTWLVGECFPSDDTPLALPLSRFPKSVATLELVGMGPGHPSRGPTLTHFLPFVGVTQLHLLGFNHVEEAFSLLSHHDGTDRSNILFPKLTSIGINNLDFEDLFTAFDFPVEKKRAPPWPVFGLESGHKVVQMLRSRIGLVDEFTLTAGRAHLTLHWDDEAWDALRKLKQDGLNLTIIESGHPIII